MAVANCLLCFETPYGRFFSIIVGRSYWSIFAIVSHPIYGAIKSNIFFQIPMIHCSCYSLLQVESEKTDSSQLKREIQTLEEACTDLQKKNDRVHHDLGNKETQIMCLQVLQSFFLKFN